MQGNRDGQSRSTGRRLTEDLVRIIRALQRAIVPKYQLDRKSTSRSSELFTNLLFAIAEDLRYTFDRVQLKTGSYSPVAHGDIEADQTAIRKLVVKLLSGERALKMEVEKLAVDPAALKAQIELQQAMRSAFTGDGALNVHVRDNEPS
jgi:hypothetical protein